MNLKSKIGETHLLNAFGSAIRAKRLALKLSQEELAHRCELDRTYIGGIERGERNISLINIAAVSDALGIPSSELMKSAEKLIKSK